MMQQICPQHTELLPGLTLKSDTNGANWSCSPNISPKSMYTEARRGSHLVLWYRKKTSSVLWSSKPRWLPPNGRQTSGKITVCHRFSFLFPITWPVWWCELSQGVLELVAFPVWLLPLYSRYQNRRTLLTACSRAEKMEFLWPGWKWAWMPENMFSLSLIKGGETWINDRTLYSAVVAHTWNHHSPPVHFQSMHTKGKITTTIAFTWRTLLNACILVRVTDSDCC